MTFTYSVKIRKDGVLRVGRDPVPEELFAEHMNERRKIQSGALDTPCWLWTGSYTTRGYGSVMFQGRVWRVTRLSWKLNKGPIPDGMEVCHRCDTPACFNPDHLFIGTHLENMRDAFSKGRIEPRRGEAHGHSKLTEKDVLNIRKEYLSENKHALAKKFGVNSGTIWKVATRRIWKHLP